MKRLFGVLWTFAVLLCGWLLLEGPVQHSQHSWQRAASAAHMNTPSMPRAALAAAPAITRTVYLPLVAASKPRASMELIDAALARGEVDAETAFVFKTYAVFDDPRLPIQYKGLVSEAEAEEVVRQFGVQMEGLSAAGQRALLPFIQPPVYVDSWYALQHPTAQTHEQATASDSDSALGPPVGPGWQSAGPADGKVKVWWNQNDTPGLGRAASLIAEAMNGIIWPKETALLVREPLSDSGPHVFEDKEGQTHILGDGGDGRLDIYLITSRAGSDQLLLGYGGAATLNYPPGCKKRPAYMLVSGALLLDDLKLESALIHEFSHAIQFAYDYAKECQEYRWMEEATAVWMVDYVSPSNQREHLESEMAQYPGMSLDEQGYDAWPFFFFLARQYSPTILRFAWSQTEYDDSLASIDAALSGDGGLLKYWHEFALRAWNQPPVDQFQQWDKYGLGAKASDETIHLGGLQASQLDLRKVVDHLSAAYYDIRITDPNVRSVLFWNPFKTQVPRDPAAKVRALIKIQGRDWVQEDWTDLYSRAFCRDLRDDRVEELVIIISNSAWQDRSHVLETFSPPHLVASNIGCWRWSGSVTAVLRAGSLGGNVTDSFTAQVVWERDAGQNPLTPGLQYTYHVVPGPNNTLSGTRSGTDGSDCTVYGSVSGVPLRVSDGWINLQHIYTYQPNDFGRFYANATASQAGNHFDRTCPDSGTTTFNWDGFRYMNTLNQAFYVSADGRRLYGTASDGGGTYTWDLTAANPQP